MSRRGKRVSCQQLEIRYGIPTLEEAMRDFENAPSNCVEIVHSFYNVNVNIRGDGNLYISDPKTDEALATYKVVKVKNEQK